VWPEASQAPLWETPPSPNSYQSTPATMRVPAQLREMFETCACHCDPSRYARMYRVLWRSLHGEHALWRDTLDPDMVALASMAQAVRRDAHRMTAFVRFRELPAAEGAPRYVAWYEPEHHILRRTAPFFVRRFGTMVWTIATPDGVAHWNREALAFLPPDASLGHPADDAAEGLWLTYYESIFNPARLNVTAMQRHMPQKYWSNLPEVQRIPALVAHAAERAGRMIVDVESLPAARRPPRARPAPAMLATASGDGLPGEDELDACRRCELWEHATQAVAGEGATPAPLMLVGEQPGDEEDIAGRPFVGPAGRLLRKALEDAGVDVADVFITNAVKHFYFEPRGKRRIHKTPMQRHIAACHDWLEREIAAVQPAVIVTLGATALVATFGKRVTIADARTQTLNHHGGARIVATYHPSAVLRAPDEDARATLLEALVADLKRARQMAR